jgi:hypothetical protein
MRTAVLSALLLLGCADGPFVAVVGACDQLEERIVSSGGENAEGRLACAEQVCTELLQQIDPEAAAELGGEGGE